VFLVATAAFGIDDYKSSPDSEAQPGVPRVKCTLQFCGSKVYPGAERDYRIYVPAQYDESKPACLMISASAEIVTAKIPKHFPDVEKVVNLRDLLST
jgi:hypothetical protein